jgi:hypothetical protein
MDRESDEVQQLYLYVLKQFEASLSTWLLTTQRKEEKVSFSDLAYQNFILVYS